MIDYVLLAEAKQYYEKKGYKYIEVPWEVERRVSNITKPVDRRDYQLNDGVLVASGEQSFLQMIVNGQLPKGQYQCITPCFRGEPVIDETHQPYFMKLELINTDFPFRPVLDQMIDDAFVFLSHRVKCKIIETGWNTFDIVTENKEIEIGSYGIRWDHDIIKNSWIYATGLAEPRYSWAVENCK